MKGKFPEGQKLLLREIAGSRNLTFSEPIELEVKWQSLDHESNLIDIGCKISTIASASEKQYVDFIQSEVKFTGRLRGGRFVAMSTTFATKEK
jgi:hypothetical protein